jgi:hypothetical protein
VTAIRRISLLLVALGATAVLAACGGDGGNALSKQEYDQRMQQIDAQLEQEAGKFDSADSNQSLEDLAGLVGDFQARVRDAAGEMDDLEPPAAIADEHDRLVQQTRRFADQLDNLKEAVDEGDAAKIQQVGAEIQETTRKQLVAAAKAIEAEGYDIGDWSD